MESPSSVPPESSGLSRRQFVRGAAALMTGLTFNKHSWGQTDATGNAVNNDLIDITTADIPGLIPTDKILHPNASKGICLLQRTGGYAFDRRVIERNPELVEGCEDGLYDGLVWMMQDSRIRLRKILSENIKERSDIRRQAQILGVPLYREKPSPQEIARYGAEWVAATTHGLHIAGLEEEDVMNEVQDTWRNAMQFKGEPVDYRNPLTMEKRQDGWLVNAHWDIDDIVFALVGEEHDIKDNINYWNEKFYSKISLVVLTQKMLVRQARREHRHSQR